jgi:hypothetical protein
VEIGIGGLDHHPSGLIDGEAADTRA